MGIERGPRPVPSICRVRRSNSWKGSKRSTVMALPPWYWRVVRLRCQAAGLAITSSAQPTRAAGGTAPTWRATSPPWRRTSRVGMPRTPRRSATRGASSTLTLTTFRRPASSCAACSTPGATTRQGPHHGAHRSTSTGRLAAVTTCSKSPSPAEVSQGRAVWQAAHRATPLAAAGRRLRLPQLGHVTIWAMLRPPPGCLGVVDDDQLVAVGVHPHGDAIAATPAWPWTYSTAVRAPGPVVAPGRPARLLQAADRAFQDLADRAGRHSAEVVQWGLDRLTVRPGRSGRSTPAGQHG